jgi:hypothetical protein
VHPNQDLPAEGQHLEANIPNYGATPSQLFDPGWTYHNGSWVRPEEYQAHLQNLVNNYFNPNYDPASDGFVEGEYSAQFRNDLYKLGQEKWGSYEIYGPDGKTPNPFAQSPGLQVFNEPIFVGTALIQSLGAAALSGVRASFAEGAIQKEAEMLALPAPRQIEAHWGVNTYRHGGEMSAIEHINYRHAFNSGFSNVSRYAEGTSVQEIRSFADEALRYGTISPNGQNGFLVEYNLGKLIGLNQQGGPATGVRMFIRDGSIQTIFPISFH